MNWLLYIYLVVNGQALQTSIAYLTTPLLNVAPGGILFREHLGRIEWSAIVIAALGVGMFAAQSPTFPWMAIVLATSFSVYGLLKRYVPLDAAQATTFEPEAVVSLGLCFGSPAAARAALAVDAAGRTAGGALRLGHRDTAGHIRVRRAAQPLSDRELHPVSQPADSVLHGRVPAARADARAGV